MSSNGTLSPLTERNQMQILFLFLVGRILSPSVLVHVSFDKRVFKLSI